jgi:hypothetical protein
MHIQNTPGSNDFAGIPLLALAAPSALVVASWLMETAGVFPTGSRAAGFIALLLIGGSFLSLVAIVVIVRRLIYVPTTRRWPYFVLLAISVVAFVPAVSFATVLLMGHE